MVVPGANGTVRTLTDAHRGVIADAETLLLQLELPLSVVVEAAVFARAHGTFTVLTPAPVQPLPDELLAAVDLIVANEREAATAEHCDVLITRGAAGVRYLRAGTSPLDVPAFGVTAVDTTAAGDTFVGAFVVARAESPDLERVLCWASAAAALSVQRFGASTSMPRRAEIEAFVGERAARR